VKSPLVQKIGKDKALNEELRAQLLVALKEFKEKYLADRGGAAERGVAG
jgi:hypothetical protein